ncbi:transglutaminase family protein [Methylocapsa sp. S129]|uniref:transglutaminase family protein n=1 Tax=Methylocapsa sp. S129 TaxID=1641869 RepID=UPI00131B3C66|nr:transglutaminase family protein [Methylocapsa sp. S129]
MIYDVRHLTRYRYEAPVAANTCTLRLLLRSIDGQSVLASRIDVAPTPNEWNERVDIFGNRVARMRIEKPHRELVITSTARVDVHRPAPPAPGLTPAWESVARDATASASLASDSPAFALYASRLVGIFEAATDYARTSFSPRRPIYEAALELNGRIKADFAYDTKSTGVTTSPADAFAKRSGVCQDFAHVMIAGLRGLGLPALYVSGYIRTVPPPGKARLAGADASHAWVSVWCGQEFGWLGLDPTNAIAEGDDHIVIAVGRDYSDAAPVEGVILSSGGQKLDVAVDVIPVRG